MSRACPYIKNKSFQLRRDRTVCAPLRSFSNVFKWQFENTEILNSQFSILNSQFARERQPGTRYAGRARRRRGMSLPYGCCFRFSSE